MCMYDILNHIMKQTIAIYSPSKERASLVAEGVRRIHHQIRTVFVPVSDQQFTEEELAETEVWTPDSMTLTYIDITAEIEALAQAGGTVEDIVSLISQTEQAFAIGYITCFFENSRATAPWVAEIKAALKPKRMGEPTKPIEFSNMLPKEKDHKADFKFISIRRIMIGNET